MKNVFVSYSHKDLEFAKKLVNWLEGKGYKVWMDKRRILPGANYLESIADGIGKADAFIPLLSAESVSSKWVAREIIFALEHDRNIIPVLVQFAELPDGLKFAITGLHHVDFTEGEQNINPWEALDNALKSTAKKGDSDTSNENAGRLTKDQEANLQHLLDYIDSQKKKSNLLMGGIAVILAILIANVGFLLLKEKPDEIATRTTERDTKIVAETAKQEEPKKIDAILIKGVSREVENALRVAYTGEIRETAPSAAIGVIVQPGGSTSEQWRPLRDGEPLSSSYNYRIVFQPDKKAYFYIFQIDSTGKLDWIFPKNNSSPYSSGKNPTEGGLWTKIPSGEDALHLDENLGIEHIYIVATPSRWEALEKALSDAAKTQAVPVDVPLGLRTRGVGGARKTTAVPENIDVVSEEIRQMITGKNGVLVQERWFQHVAP